LRRSAGGRGDRAGDRGGERGAHPGGRIPADRAGGRVRLRNVRRVLAKELRETLRDRRTVLVMVVVPVFLYPVLLVVLEQLALFGRRQMEEAPAAVAFVGEWSDAAEHLYHDPSIRLGAVDSVPWAELRAGGVDAVVVFEPAPEAQGTASARILYDASRERSGRARGVVRSGLAEWADTVLARRLRAEGLPSSFSRPLAVADSSVASAERLGGYTLGRFLPM